MKSLKKIGFAVVGAAIVIEEIIVGEMERLGFHDELARLEASRYQD